MKIYLKYIFDNMYFSRIICIFAFMAMILILSTTGFATVLSQSNNTTTITVGGSLRCGGSGGTVHQDTSYWRAFNLNGAGFTTSKVRVGIESTVSTSATQPVTARIYANNTSSFPGGVRTLIQTATFNLAPTTLSFLEIPIVAVVPAGTLQLVAEINTPAGAGNSAFIGANSLGETATGYISAAGCGAANPTTPASLGFPNVHFLISVTDTVARTPYDFDSDGKTDISVFRPSLGQWWYLRSSDNANRAFSFGSSTDKMVPADYTGDGKTDIATFNPSNGNWDVLRSEDSTFYGFPFGTSGDIAAPADFDGDGKADAAVFRVSNSTWYISKSSGGTTIQQFGANGDKPTVADYDGDGKADLAIYRVALGQWWYLRSSDGANRAFQFGTATDKPMQGDYTGDGKADLAFFRQSTGEWFVLRSEDSTFYGFPFGANGDIPASGDYDGDGRFDAAVFRPTNTTWYLNRSTSGVGIVGFGVNGDQPVPSAFVP
jgi:FG-GAP-like repeat